jgi:hypothetical protein
MIDATTYCADGSGAASEELAVRPFRLPGHDQRRWPATRLALVAVAVLAVAGAAGRLAGVRAEPR